MNVLKRHKNKIVISVYVLAVLIFAFLLGGNAPGLRGKNTEQPHDTSVSMYRKTAQDVESAYLEKASDEQQLRASDKDNQEIPIKKPDKTADADNKPEKKDGKPLTASEKIEAAQEIAQEYTDENNNREDTESGNIDTALQDKPLPAAANEGDIADTELTCTLSVKCDTILDNISWLNKDKHGLVPKDGVIFPEQTVIFHEGETVFNLLTREMKKNKIHIEFAKTPAYNSVYIEGINNLYEYDCGELSGWVYKVNDWFPNYGCSRYELKDGDRVEFVYTCSLGVDVGGYNNLSGE